MVRAQRPWFPSTNRKVLRHSPENSEKLAAFHELDTETSFLPIYIYIYSPKLQGLFTISGCYLCVLSPLYTEIRVATRIITKTARTRQTVQQQCDSKWRECRCSVVLLWYPRTWCPPYGSVRTYKERLGYYGRVTVQYGPANKKRPI